MWRNSSSTRVLTIIFLTIMKCCIPPNRTLDYGSGFYTTTDYDQAEQWARRRLRKSNSEAFVNIYEVDIDAIRKANTLWLDSPSEEWVDL